MNRPSNIYFGKVLNGIHQLFRNPLTSQLIDGNIDLAYRTFDINFVAKLFA